MQYYGYFHETYILPASNLESSQKYTELRNIPTIKIGKPYNGSHKVSLPSVFLEILELGAGDRLRVDLKGKSMILTPIAAQSGKIKTANGVRE